MPAGDSAATPDVSTHRQRRTRRRRPAGDSAAPGPLLQIRGAVRLVCVTHPRPMHPVGVMPRLVCAGLQHAMPCLRLVCARSRHIATDHTARLPARLSPQAPRHSPACWRRLRQGRGTPGSDRAEAHPRPTASHAPTATSTARPWTVGYGRCGLSARFTGLGVSDSDGGGPTLQPQSTQSTVNRQPVTASRITPSPQHPPLGLSRRRIRAARQPAHGPQGGAPRDCGAARQKRAGLPSLSSRTWRTSRLRRRAPASRGCPACRPTPRAPPPAAPTPLSPAAPHGGLRRL